MSNTIIKKNKYSNKAMVLINRTFGDQPGQISARPFKDEYSDLSHDCELHFMLDSNGGSVAEAREFYRTIRGHQGPTTAHIQGLCASSASFVAMGCDTIRMSNDALLMIHNPHWSVSRSEAMCSVGNQKMITIPRQYNQQMPITVPVLVKDKNASVRRTLEENRRTIKKHRNLLNDRKKILAEAKEFILDVYVLRSGANRDDLRAMMLAETWLTASDCIQFGMADEITSPTGLVDHVDFSQFANPTNFLAGRYMNSAQTARASRRRKVNRKQVAFMRATVQKILTQRQQEA